MKIIKLWTGSGPKTDSNFSAGGAEKIKSEDDGFACVVRDDRINQSLISSSTDRQTDGDGDGCIRTHAYEWTVG